MSTRPERRGGWSGGPAPDGRKELFLAVGALVLGLAATAVACGMILRL